MKIKTAQPIFGFEDINEYEFEKIDDFFYSLKADKISFTLIDPLTIREYEFEIDDSLYDLLDSKNSLDIKVFNIVTIKNPIENSTINFLAPILINIKNKLLAQIILDDKRYPNFKLNEEIKKFL